MSTSIGDYMDICAGNNDAGMLLYKLAMLARRGELFEGARWALVTRNEMIADAHLHTKRRYDDAIAFLREHGLVETKTSGDIGVPAFQKANRATAVTIPVKTFEAIHASRARRYRTPRTSDVDQFLHDIVPGHGLKIDATEGVSLPQDSVVIAQDQASHCPGIGVSLPQKHDPSLLLSLNYNLEAKTASEPAKAGRPRRANSVEVQVVFRDTMPKVDPNYFHTPWTKNLQSAAKLLVQKNGLDRTVRMVETCLLSWGTFAEYARERSPLKVTDKPSMLTLITHAQAAYEFANTQALAKPSTGLKKAAW